MLLCLYSLLLVIRFEANQSESDPFFASKRINIRFDIRLYSLRSEYRGNPTLTPSQGAQEPVLQCSTPYFDFICASLIFIRFNYIRFISYLLAYIRFFQLFASKRIKANLTLLFASKRINIRFDIRLYSLRKANIGDTLGRLDFSTYFSSELHAVQTFSALLQQKELVMPYFLYGITFDIHIQKTRK